MARRRNDSATLTYAQQRVLKALQARDDWASIGDLAEVLDIHKNSVRSAIKVLLSKDFINREQLRTGERGRPCWLYKAHSEPSSHLASAWGAMEGAPATERDQLEALLAGKHVGSLEGAADIRRAMVDFLERQDMEARLAETGIEITDCPFRTINNGKPSYACRLHRIMLEAAAGPSHHVRVRPMCVDGICQVLIDRT